MTINGWKRIGIIASIAWVVGAWFYTFNTNIDHDLALSAEIYAPCFESAQTTAAWQACRDAQYKEVGVYIRNDRAIATATAVVPVPFAWGFAYLVVFLVGWVKRGFVQAKDRR